MDQLVLKKVKEILKANLAKVTDEDKIVTTDRLIYDLGMDSYACTTIAYEISQAYTIEMTETQLDGCKTVADVVSFIEARTD